MIDGCLVRLATHAARELSGGVAVELRDIVNRGTPAIKSYLHVLLSPHFGGQIAIGEVQLDFEKFPPAEALARLQHRLSQPWPLQPSEVESLFIDSYRFRYAFGWTPVTSMTKLVFDRRGGSGVAREVAGRCVAFAVKYLAPLERRAVPAFTQTSSYFDEKPQSVIPRYEFQRLLSNAVAKEYSNYSAAGLREVVTASDGILESCPEWDGKYSLEEIQSLCQDRGLAIADQALIIESKLVGDRMRGVLWINAVERLLRAQSEHILSSAEVLDQLVEEEIGGFTEFIESLK